MNPANATEATDREDGDGVPSRTPPSPGRSDPYANTRVWQPTRSNMPGESIHVADGPKLFFSTPAPRLKLLICSSGHMGRYRWWWKHVPGGWKLRHEALDHDHDGLLLGYGIFQWLLVRRDVDIVFDVAYHFLLIRRTSAKAASSLLVSLLCIFLFAETGFANSYEWAALCSHAEPS